MPSLQLTLRSVDENGTSVHSGFHVEDTADDPADFNVLSAAYQAATNAELLSADLTLSAQYTGTLTTGSALDAEDKAVLAFLDEDGRTCIVTVPAPKAAMFMADGKTVSTTHEIVTALIAAILSAVVTAGGVALESFIKGWRNRRNRK